MAPPLPLEPVPGQRRKLSVVLVVQDEEQRIDRALESIRCADEVLVVDGGSTDGTLALCRQRGCRVLQRPFDGFGAQKRIATTLAAHDWVLSVDADEVLSPELNEEILRVLARPEIPEAAFQIEMTMVFLGRVFRHGRHARERHVRLFDRSRAGFNGNEVHEGVTTAGPVGRLGGQCLHFSYRDVAHYLAKVNDYSTRGARMLERRGARRSATLAILSWPFYFLRSYFLHGNVLNGVPGLVWSFLYTLHPVLKYLKLAERNGIA